MQNPMKEELKKKLNEFYKDASREELILMLLAARKRDKTMYRRKITIKPAEMEKVEDIMRIFGPYIREHCQNSCAWHSRTDLPVSSAAPCAR